MDHGSAFCPFTWWTAQVDDIERSDLLRRLQATFPDQSSEQIAAVVQTAIDRLAGRPIQDFTPVLVERAATGALRTAGTA